MLVAIVSNMQSHGATNRRAGRLQYALRERIYTAVRMHGGGRWEGGSRKKSSRCVVGILITTAGIRRTSRKQISATVLDRDGHLRGGGVSNIYQDMNMGMCAWIDGDRGDVGCNG